VGYNVVVPCERCFNSCNNGHLNMFHEEAVQGSETKTQEGTPLLWANIPDKVDIRKEMELPVAR
jgi:hypothetical protein